MKYATKNQFHHHYDMIDVLDAHMPTSTVKIKITYNFFNHFHPFTGELIEQLNKKSLAGLFDVDFQSRLVDDFFKGEYEPNENDDTPQAKHPLKVNYPKKELDLSEGGPYSAYNWELFFHAPLTIAVHLSKNQRFSEAQKWFHYIFDPSSNDKSAIDAPLRFWKFRQFRQKKDIQLINELLTNLSDPKDNELRDRVSKSIEGWRNKPFQPHVIARNRFLAYQFYVVMKYLDNLIAWGDSLFRQDTIEAINEATQIYILAANILGPKPQEIPRMAKTRPKTYAILKKKLDAFGNALIDMEGQFPFNLSIPSTSTTNTSATNQTNSLFGIAKSLYFCIPQNDKLLGYWDTVADRLFKIRHCMNIEGIVRQLPLFEPPISLEMLVKAAAAGIDISSVVSGLNQPSSLIRAPLLIQKALEICSEVKSLGNALLSALEKKDAEEMALLRQAHEIKILQLVEDVKYLQWKEAESATEALLKTRSTTYQRYRHYQLLLGEKEQDLNEIKDLGIERRELNKDNFDEVYNELVGKYVKPIDTEEYRQEQADGDLVEQGATAAAGWLGAGGGTNNLELNSSESKDLNTFMPLAHMIQQSSGVVEAIASALSLVPEVNVHATPVGVGAAVEFGGRELSTFTSIGARILRLAADDMTYRSNRASKLASYQRRIEDWVLQNNMAASELVQIGRQVISSLIREQIARKEYENHKKQIEHAQEIDTFLKEKFTNQDLYTWMQGEISKIYYECYKFAFDIAKKAEQTMKHELMRKELDDITFIKFNYWEIGRKGLLSGEALYLDLKRMEMAYYDHDKREYEITKHISLQQLNPQALLQLKATGSCEITIPEWLFDIDCPGHYMRRIKTMSLSVPCVVGPYTSINCTLSLMKNTLRKSSLLKDEKYERQGTEDDRFIDYYGTIQSIVTSNAQNDSGLFETNLRDERYLPFEGGGVESTWKLELPSKFKQFDYNTISDVILHFRYTAREGGALLKDGSIKKIEEIIENASSSGLARSFSLRHDFPTEWHRFISSTENMKIVIKKDYFPYFAQSFRITVSRIDLFAINKDNGSIAARNLTNINFNKLNEEINDDDNDAQTELIIESDSQVLTRKKDEQVFVVLGYTMEKLTL
jgi:Tc toxin complex TcA C-terminal TcB-binding domain